MGNDMHPFVREAAEQTRKGFISRRDFFKYAACFGISAMSAGTLLGLSAPEIALAAEPDWKGLAKESPFEIKNRLIDMAEEACSKQQCSMINAGRGNPNFLNTTVRKGLSLLTLFAAETAESESPAPDTGLRIAKDGLAERFNAFIQAQRGAPGAVFLEQAMDYAARESGLDADELIFELTDGIQGDFYPDPPRIFPATEAIVNHYLDRVVFSGKPPKGKFNLFATEGATAAMIYIFNSLKENMVLTPGDKVAIVTPIFSPYLELPVLRDYGLEPVYIRGSEAMQWQVPDSEVAKLKDPKVKALYMVNPTNPTSVSLDADTVRRMAGTIKAHNPDMVIISDTVYASFVDEFNTFGALLPENILGVYSFSKYFGVTGWRLGVVMVHENCVIDRLIAALPKKKQAQLDLRYRLTSTKPGSIKFLDRLEMDSRQVALAHTGGLSGPQQAAMCLFSLFELLDETFAYKKSIMGILGKRWTALFKAVGLPEPKGNNLTRYYALIDLEQLATKLYGSGFAKSLSKRHALEFLFRLAGKYHTVCLPGAGFAGPAWSLRVALANISEEDCTAIGKNILAVMADYKKELG
ncbi:bifunctional aspartate transaminase/aspartate 4-decarboxylase [Pseudodesulfovibrio cashew]|uniref:Aminotransferase n=1 Tax=Pseudodesulfovibrio cashew TaxID=2678688 RepID=A0A6I6JST4_9BACT|nr:bifunctional aspartate transaminase/aspartate 4-decarboxylase [Pseudodesulfovibrio cashew]QGY40654.1 bifunctional aspartate transaminase/aspartate 4-decarboxylase [Pseudodesulfovibrio cashew]